MQRQRISAAPVREGTNPNVGSQCLRVGNLVFVSGQIAHENGQLVGKGDALEQCRQAFRNIRALIEAAGGSLDHVTQLTIYLSDIRHREVTRAARAEFFKDPAPTASVIGGVDLAFDDLLVEIDAIAVLPEA
jgi:enamine deaminase RidA (YjgF/YER057c/UK114 family)